MLSDDYLRADPLYRNAQRQGSRSQMDMIVDRSPLWIRTIEVLARPSSIFSLALLGLCVFVLVNF